MLKSLGKSNSVILTHLNDRLIVKTDFRAFEQEVILSKAKNLLFIRDVSLTLNMTVSIAFVEGEKLTVAAKAAYARV